MTINRLAKLVSELEGKKVQVNIAQIKEVLACVQKVLRNKLDIDFYTIVRSR
jgi:MarR-like DNA-binding transcriptional regulator SgrR of sgrS sRNA